MKKFSLPLSISLVITVSMSLMSCDKVKQQATEKAKEVATEKMNEAINETIDKASEEIQKTELSTEIPEKNQESIINFNGEFDWSNIPISTANIGSFPYISAPEGMYHRKSDSNSEPAPADQPYSMIWDFSKLIMFNGESVFDAEGKRAFLYVDIKDKDKAFNQLVFDKNIDVYLTQIGAVEIFNDKIPGEVLQKLNEKNSMTVHQYITGDVYNEPIKMYALNHSNGKVFFQIWSDDGVHGEIGIVELEGFEPTIKAPTASEIKQQLDANGKAILHINFDTGKSSMKADGQAVVEQINLLLTQNPDIKLSIEGHTDNVGDSVSNQKLSESRANTVMYALAGKGIDVSRLSAKGLGDTVPVADNTVEEGRAKNRRVELVKQ